MQLIQNAKDVKTTKKRKCMDRIDSTGMPLEWLDLKYGDLLEITDELCYMWKELKRLYGWSHKYDVYPTVDGFSHNAFIKPAYHGCSKRFLREDSNKACAFTSKEAVAEYIKRCWKQQHSK